MQLDYSLENEKKMAEYIDQFYRNFMMDNVNRTYKFTSDGYFTTEDAKVLRSVMEDNTLWMCKIPVEIYIGETSEADS